MPKKLEIHERFKDARIIHNKNGKQTMEEVANATGIQKSMISSLEKDDTRGASFRDVAKLAKHYGVSMDWLCGLTELPTVNSDIRAVCEKTGLSVKAVECLFFIQQSGHIFKDSFKGAPFSELKSLYSFLICENNAFFEILNTLILKNSAKYSSDFEANSYFLTREQALLFYDYSIQNTLKNLIEEFDSKKRGESEIDGID